MTRAAATTILLVLAAAALRALYTRLGMPALPPAVTLGFILVAGYTFSRLFVPLHLPRVSAYLLMGMICGPFGLALITESSAQELKLIEQSAIALIALTAGGEIRWALLRSRWRSFLTLTASLAVVIVPLTAAVMLAVGPHLPLFRGAGTPVIFVAALLLGITGMVKALSTTVAVIKETDARGLLSETVLAVLVLVSVLAIFLYTIVLGLAEGVLGGPGRLGGGELIGLFWRIAGALPVGGLIGLLAALYLKYERQNNLLFVLFLCLLLVAVAQAWQIDLIMMGVMTGFAVENLSNRGRDLITAVDRSYLPVYVAFFTLAGAEIDFSFLFANWALTGGLILLVAALTWLGAELGGWLVRLPRPARHYFFMGMIAQAGVNLGFATVIRDRLTMPLPSGPSLGQVIYNITLACIAVNEVIGPILFRFALERVGEIGRNSAAEGE